MILNLETFRKEYSPTQLILMCCAKEWKYVDQDVLNILCHNQVQYLPYEWNYRVDHDSLGILLINECRYSSTFHVSDPKIYHFAGMYKPWNISDLKYSDKFWDIAGKSIFYSDILMDSVAYSRSMFSSTGIQPNLIPLDHPMRKYIDLVMPKGSKLREIVKAFVRIIRSK